MTRIERHQRREFAIFDTPHRTATANGFGDCPLWAYGINYLRSVFFLHRSSKDNVKNRTRQQTTLLVLLIIVRYAFLMLEPCEGISMGRLNKAIMFSVRWSPFRWFKLYPFRQLSGWRRNWQHRSHCIFYFAWGVQQRTEGLPDRFFFLYFLPNLFEYLRLGEKFSATSR